MLKELFGKIGDLRVGVIGDFALDVYWQADMRLSELSRETPHYPLPVVEERMSLGAAGNVASNVAALKPRSVHAIGLVGNDWRGDSMLGLMRAANIDTDGLLAGEGFCTSAYIKPLRQGISDVVYEDPRLDFENRAPLSAQQEEVLLQALDKLAPGLDALCVCDQMKNGCITPRVREKLAALGEEGLAIFADSRDRASLFRHVIVKPNDLEARQATGAQTDEEAARLLSEQTRRPVVVTLGDRGCLVYDGGSARLVPARKAEPPLDIVGAGDAFLSALACAFAAGLPLTDAALVANTASAIVIRKIGVTGTATCEEIAKFWDK